MLVRQWRNLLAVPSYHYSPVFAKAVASVFNEHAIDAVALELPADAGKELEWADSCWPEPVASVCDGAIFPFVPGDSMIEGFRLARKHNVPVHLIDLHVQDTMERQQVSLPGPEFAPRLGALFQETVDSIHAMHPTADGDVAREAFMARRIATLLDKHKKVLWIGGMAHWTAIVRRLTESDFIAPDVAAVQSCSFVRSRLRSSALYEISGQLPHLVHRYARNQGDYDESTALHDLALRVLRSSAQDRVELISPGGRSSNSIEPPESQLTLDVVKMLTYAQNLAATSGLRETPTLTDLLMSASSTIGNKYAGRFYLAAMREAKSKSTTGLPSLTFAMGKRQYGYRLNRRWISAKPYSKSGTPGGRRWSVYTRKVRSRLKSDRPYSELPALKKGEKAWWTAFPPDEDAYEAYIRHVLLIANRKVVCEVKSEPFSTGLRDGIDVRTTLRHWRQGDIYVRVGEKNSLNISSGAIDYVNESESAAMLQGSRAASYPSIGLLDPRSSRFNVDHDTGWLDPDCLHVGGVSREVTPGEILQQRDKPCWVVRRQREFSFLTLDLPNWYKHLEFQRNDFIGKVTLNLAELPRAKDNLYGWLHVMFSFCRSKPFAYFSKYVPSQRIHQVAATYGVNLIHIPLSLIPSRLLEMHRHFRFLLLSVRQRDALLKLIAEGKRAWAPESG